MLVWQGVGARLRQQVLWGARDPVLTLGVLGAQGARGGHALDLSAEWALAGAHSLAHCTARHYWILLGTVSRNTHTHTQLFCLCSRLFYFSIFSINVTFRLPVVQFSSSSQTKNAPALPLAKPFCNLHPFVLTVQNNKSHAAGWNSLSGFRFSSVKVAWV